jgi:hypothetical protein
MGWEERNGKLYYYRKQRIGHTVVSVYLGSGYLAEMIAEEDALEREYEQMKREGERELMEADQEIDRELDEIGYLVRRLTYSVLLDLGYHTHKGQWRKIRDDRE